MFLEKPKIKDGAIFVSDAHAKDGRWEFFWFLEKLERGEIKTPQLFLMGDMFELLIGQIRSSITANQLFIDKLNLISENIEVFYFEGNHDFNLAPIFPNIKIYPMHKQPAQFNINDCVNDCVALLCHGDIGMGRGYDIYTTLIRNKFILNILNVFDLLLGGKIYKSILKTLAKKNICLKFDNFEEKMRDKIADRNNAISKYITLEDANFLLEGHHHQNKEIRIGNFVYKNFPSLFCDKIYFIFSMDNMGKKGKFIENRV